MKKSSLLLAFATGLLTSGALGGQTIDYVGSLDFIPSNSAVANADVRFVFSLPEGPVAMAPHTSFGTLDSPSQAFETTSTLTINGQSAVYELWITPFGQVPEFARPSPYPYAISDEFAFYPDQGGPSYGFPEYTFYLSGADITRGSSSPAVLKPGTFEGDQYSVALYDSRSPLWTSADATSFDSSLVDRFEVAGTVTPVPERPMSGLLLAASLAALGLGVRRRLRTSVAPSHDVT
jgi:hypothetical protein